jgi:hypothetical protein
MEFVTISALLGAPAVPFIPQCEACDSRRGIALFAAAYRQLANRKRFPRSGKPVSDMRRAQ